LPFDLVILFFQDFPSSLIPPNFPFFSPYDEVVLPRRIDDDVAFPRNFEFPTETQKASLWGHQTNNRFPAPSRLLFALASSPRLKQTPSAVKKSSLDFQPFKPAARPRNEQVDHCTLLRFVRRRFFYFRNYGDVA